jgi:hypothetical protein
MTESVPQHRVIHQSRLNQPFIKSGLEGLTKGGERELWGTFLYF